MDQKSDFLHQIDQGYNFKGDSLVVGAPIFGNEVMTGHHISIPLETMNRHGLISGATGTGKTKSLQVLAEGLSQKGVPVLLMDLKGDLSGLAAAGNPHPKIDERQEKIGLTWESRSFPVELMSLSEQEGVRLRATVSEFGPILLSRILDLNDTQQGIVAVIFKYCDDHKMPLLDLNDFKKILRYATEEGKEAFEQAYGRVSTASTGAILRKIIELEQQGADRFFGERSFEVKDLVRKTPEGEGYINIIRLDDIQDRPKLFSTFMLSLLAEVYNTFPELGDPDKPELVLFIDEAHLIFDQASEALLDQLESMVKLIRSKGIGLFFITQDPTDIPESVLSQLGLKVQHALRAFTAKDRKKIKMTAQNYPLSDFYDTAEVLTNLGIGEALVTALDEKGRPTPLSATMMRAPQSRMDILSAKEIEQVHRSSVLTSKYEEDIDRESAYEILSRKIEEAREDEQMEQAKKEREKLSGRTRRSTRQNPVLKVLTSAAFIRGVMGILNKAMR
ncbi:helicase HerA-like domain-containing protein [Robertkochia aurantiaca]|uniref:helicase HerA-like domain-containing protein n=1 Tax=Robertkochia aurantiaca TaxID=2873700 RepID=UPI001CCF34DB|nr:helicase HerA-like domain-containing protein [Robertkochia sp. 3YJGBD-33]